MPPSDPRYLSMTDDEIYFDYLTVQAALGMSRQVHSEPVESEPTPRLPEFEAEGMGSPNKSRKMTFSADEDEFRRWFEQEVGAWDQTSLAETPEP